MSAERPFLKKEFRDIVTALLDDLRSGSGGRVALTDAAEGSVVRTVVEAFGRQLAVAHEQLERVYRSGYVDTAEGVALDNVVALLGVTRRRAGRVQGTVAFTRLLPASEDIHIPAGTLVAGRDVLPFETVVNAVLPQGSTEVTAGVRATEDTQGEVPPGALSLMPRPILGIENVLNRDFLRPGAREESDDELRQRANKTIQQANLGTLAALEGAVKSLGLAKVHVREMPLEHPGELEVVIGDTDLRDDLLEKARRAVEEARPAGIRVRVNGVTRIGVRLYATLELDRDRPESEVAAIREQVTRDLSAYFSGLGVSDNVRWSKVRNILTGHDAIAEVSRTDGLEHLAIFSFESGEWQPSRAETRILGSGDMFVGAAERAELIEPVLTLRPPASDVWVDVDLAAAEEQPGAAKAIEEALNRYLVDVSPDEQINFQTLAGRTPTSLGVTPLRFTLIHVLDGRVAELKDGNDMDSFASHERPRVRHIVFKQP